MPILRIAFLTALAASFTQAQTAEGFIKIGSERREMHHARVTRVQDDTDKSKQTLHLVVSESPIPPKALFDDMKLFEARQDKTNQMVEFNFSDNGVNWLLTGKGMEGTRSMSQTPNPFPYEVAGEVVKGKIEAKGEGYEVSVSYSAPLEKRVLEPEPTPADAITAQKSPAVKAFFALDNAIRTGNKAQIIAMAPADKRQEIDKNFDQMLKFVQMMQPKNIKVLKAVEKDGEATLTLTGTQEGKPVKGEATMKLDDGKWMMINQNWRDN